MRRTECFYKRSPTLSTNSIVNNKTNQNTLSGLLNHEASLNSSKVIEMNQLFKIPKFDALPVKKTTVKSIISPRRRVQTGRVKNNTRLSQQSKMSFLPQASFINPNRRTLHYTKNNQTNARKELIKKMVYLAECALKENLEIKQTTPVKLPAGCTPRKTPRSRGFLMLPEFKRAGEKLEMGTPVQAVVRQGTVACSSTKFTPSFIEKENSIALSPIKKNKLNISLESKEDLITDLKNNLSINKATYSQILYCCQNYNTQVSNAYEKLKVLDECFENNIKDLPVCQIYNEFCLYQSKKEELYEELKTLEEKLINSMKSQSYIANTLKDYVKKRQELFDKRIKLHKDFVEVVQSALAKCENKDGVSIKEEKTKNEIEEKPKLRRSLRLSRIPKKSKIVERTPMTRKLKKLDNKSKGIQKAGK